MKQILLLLMLFCGVNCFAQKSISIEQSDSLIQNKKKIQIIDVRTPQEYASGHIKNAINIDYKSADFSEKIRKLKRKRPVVIYCRSGVRSLKAMNVMLEEGFTEVYNMKGGILAWQISYDIVKE